jgi:hypothetical protein
MQGNDTNQGSWRDRLKSMFGAHQQPNGGGAGSAEYTLTHVPWPAGYPDTETTRQSRCLEQFLVALRDMPPCRVLDLGVANQANIEYLTNLGHRISSENVLYCLDSIWGDPNVSEERKIEDFLEQTLNYQECSFGAVLVWDTLQYLPPSLLEVVVDRLQQLVVSGALLLAFFPSEEKAKAIPTYAYRIIDWRTLQVSPRALRQRENVFNNRNLERLFQHYASVKFFLTRDHLRELLVKR